jgi:glycosyltransferase involved in cell wall biosynthesis
MRIAFYAPMKPPDHPVPSGDRTMARHLVAALRLAGHQVELVSRFQSRSETASAERLTALRKAAARQRSRIATLWREGGKPDLWFTYHTYYKAPDLLGPRLCDTFAIPYVTAEASYAEKRQRDAWAPFQAEVARALKRGALHFALTGQDHEGLVRLLGDGAPIETLPPFIDAAPFARVARSGSGEAGAPVEFIAVAMMRPGAKLRSYRFLAEALTALARPDWRLTIVGDGEARGAVTDAFRTLPAERVVWRGAVEPNDLPALLAEADLYVWPGFDEAYGAGYLEAQAAGLPVVALACGGVPDAVRRDETALLAEPDAAAAAYAALIDALVLDPTLRRRMGAAGRRFVLGERSLATASARIASALAGVTRVGQAA